MKLTHNKNFFYSVGSTFILLLAFTGTFSRALANISYALLFTWLIIAVIKRINFNMPAFWEKCILFFSFTIALSVAVAPNAIIAFKSFVNILYLLMLFPAAYLAFQFNYKLKDYLFYLYGAGLLVAAILTFREAGFNFTCSRAKVSLGIMELAAVLAQLIPLLALKLAWSIENKHFKQIKFYLIFILAGFIALFQNCTRISLLIVPALLILVILIYRKLWTKKIIALFVLLAISLVALALNNTNFKERLYSSIETKNNLSNAIRLDIWQHGWNKFKERPFLGHGLNSIERYKPSDNVLQMMDESQRNSYLNDTKPYGHVHQLFLNILAESGILGLLAFLALHLPFLLLALRYINSKDSDVHFWAWALILINLQFYLNGLTDQIFTLKPLMYIYWTITAAAVSTIYNYKLNQTQHLKHAEK